MGWDTIRNSDYRYPKEPYFVKCSKYNKEATITFFYRAAQACKTDIELTRSEMGRKCDLLGDNNSVCFGCPHMPK